MAKVYSEYKEWSYDVEKDRLSNTKEGLGNKSLFCPNEKYFFPIENDSFKIFSLDPLVRESKFFADCLKEYLKKYYLDIIVHESNVQFSFKDEADRLSFIAQFANYIEFDGIDHYLRLDTLEEELV